MLETQFRQRKMTLMKMRNDDLGFAFQAIQSIRHAIQQVQSRTEGKGANSQTHTS